MYIEIAKERAERIIYEDDEDFEVIEEEIVDKSRWSYTIEYIVKHISTGKHYKVTAQKGATESQDGQEPFYDSWVKFYEVEKREVLVAKWVSV